MDPGPRLVPSVWDRLNDHDPGVTQEPASNRFQSLHQLKDALARDLELLLNTRREALRPLPAGYPQAGRSLLVYGLPDFSAFDLHNRDDRSRIQQALERTIGLFEQRLRRVRVTLKAPRRFERRLHFRVDALLRVEPMPEPVTFDAELELGTQEYLVRSGHAE